MKTWLIGALAVALVGASMPDPAEARRFGGGGSMGMQRSMPQRAAPQPAQPQRPVQAPPRQSNPQQQPGQQAGAPAAGAAAAGGAAASRSWLGPIAGLAAGLGLVALLSHLGMGAAVAQFVMLALLLLVGFIAVRFVMARMRGSQPAPATSGGAGASAMHRRETPAPATWQPAQSPQPVQPLQQPAASAGSQPAVAGAASGSTLPPLNPVWRDDGSSALDDPEPAAAEPATPRAAVPADFDSEGFARIAKALFVRLQTAHDEGDLDDIRRFTTPEMFAEIRLDLQDRGDLAQRTDVLKVDAEVVDVAEDDGRQVVTVRYRGQVVEEAGAQPTDFDEYWHLVKPMDDSRSWAIAGIEQNR
jgi:predicted lipid-binding transport protein (Tim44 family)